jgi:hypothetical protein
MPGGRAEADIFVGGEQYIKSGVLSGFPITMVIPWGFKDSSPS